MELKARGSEPVGADIMFHLLTTIAAPQTNSADELGGFDAPMTQQQNGAPRLQEVRLNQPPLSPEELLLAVSRIKKERADTPPAEENGGGGGEEAR